MQTRSIRGTGIIACFLMLVGMVAFVQPASAQETGHSYTEGGFTATWLDESYEDLTVVADPHGADSPSDTPDAYVGGEVIKAWKVSLAMNQGIAGRHKKGGVTTYAAGCNFSPDSWGKANFRPACDFHDLCYGSSSRTDRLSCDLQFLARLHAQCVRGYGLGGLKYSACKAVAKTYFGAVRTFGKSSYKGKGNPA